MKRVSLCLSRSRWKALTHGGLSQKGHEAKEVTGEHSRNYAPTDLRRKKSQKNSAHPAISGIGSRQHLERTYLRDRRTSIKNTKEHTV